MVNSHPLAWCEQHGWTEPRQLENGLWVAFPPAGDIEMPLPNQLDLTAIEYKDRRMQAVFDLILIGIITVLTAIITLLMLPFWIVPLIKNYQSLKD